MIYISDENFNSLKGINASALISNLLTDYFKLAGKSTQDITKVKEEAEKEFQEEIAKAEENLNKIILEAKKVEEIEKTKEEKIEMYKEKTKEKITNIINNAEEVFGLKISLEDAEEYLNTDYANILQFYKFKYGDPNKETS